MPAGTKRTFSPKDRFALVGIMIAAASLVWTIVAHFIPNAEPAQAQQVSRSIVTNPSANGAGSVAVMNGGQVTTTVITLKARESGGALSSPP